MVNDCLNPYSQPVTEAKLDLVYLHGGNVCCTSQINGMAYFNESRPAAEPEPVEEYYEAPEEVHEEAGAEPEENESSDEGFWLWPELMNEPEAELNMPTDEDWLIFE